MTSIQKLCVIFGTIIVALGIGFVVWTVIQNDKKLDDAIADEQAARRKAQINGLRRDYVLCRSQGRTPKQCNAIARGTILEPILTVKEIETELANVERATITRLFVGPPGQRGQIGPGGKLTVIGKRGAKGTKGDTGLRGPQGVPGIMGATGPQGVKGEQGPRGIPGQAAARGAQGPRGTQGPTGAKGDKGDAGNTGAAGPQGPQGPPGTIITVGSSCAAGATWVEIPINAPGGQRSVIVCARG